MMGDGHAAAVHRDRYEALLATARAFRERLAGGWSPAQPPILHEPNLRDSGPQCECHACIRLLLAWEAHQPDVIP